MPGRGQRGKGAKGGKPWSLAAAVLFIFVLLVPGMSGCAGQHKRESEVDPLVGPGPKGLKAETATKTNSPVPAAPTATSSASTAGMAAGEPLVGGRTLDIQDTQAVGRPQGWQGIGPDGRPLPALAHTGVTTTSGAVLHRPEPIVEPVPLVQAPPAAAGKAAPVPAVAAGSPQAATLAQLQTQLTARGVTWQRQEVAGTGVRVVCGIPDRANPDNMHIYEATAADAVAALHAVLAKIDSTPQR
jgi:hypothetical protein